MNDTNMFGEPWLKNLKVISIHNGFSFECLINLKFTFHSFKTRSLLFFSGRLMKLLNHSLIYKSLLCKTSLKTLSLIIQCLLALLLANFIVHYIC